VAGGPEAVADALLAAVEAGGDIYQDNTTVVVVRVNGN
jgi:serine/threonine protein phosphatase PrpC